MIKKLSLALAALAVSAGVAHAMSAETRQQAVMSLGMLAMAEKKCSAITVDQAAIETMMAETSYSNENEADVATSKLGMALFINLSNQNGIGETCLQIRQSFPAFIK